MKTVMHFSKDAKDFGPKINLFSFRLFDSNEDSK